jgi:hypothetical protein
MTYAIEVRGRKHRYATLEAAKAAAEDIFTATGVLVGISEIKPKVQVIKGSETGTQTNTYRVTRADGKLADVWYDPTQRLWTVFAVQLVELMDGSELGSQTGPAEYATSKAEAIELAELVNAEWVTVAQ